MTINRTTLLDLPLPVTGTESGVWGDVTNNGLTQYLDIAIAGRNALTSANFSGGALTLSLTEGDSSATNIAAGSAQYATLYVSSLAVNSTITAPSSNRAYRVVNADATYTLTVKAAGQTGVTFPVSTSGTVVFNGTDYVLLGSYVIASAGTASLPSITFTGDTNTGIFSPAADTIAFTEGGVESMRIATSGGLSIGTTTDPGAGALLVAKGILQRVSSTTSITSPLAWNSDNFDLYEATAQAGNFTINADAGTPTDARKIIFRITSDATPRVVTFTGGSSKGFKPIGTNLTVSGANFTYTLTASKTTYFGAIYDTSVARWEIVALSQEA